MIQVKFFVGSRYPVDRTRLKKAVEDVLASYHIDHAQVDVSIVGIRKIRKLNESHLHHHGKTDVLSFPQHEKELLDDFPLPPGAPPHLGDIVISFPEAVSTAKRYGKLVDEQLELYLRHGLMHLLGYHHD